MKKDFSQPFTIEPLSVQLLVQDTSSKKFLLLRPTDDVYEYDWHSLLHCVVQPGEQLSRAVTRFLFEHDLIVYSLREMARQTNIAYSFADDTPGSETTMLCLLAHVDVLPGFSLDTDKQEAVFVPLDELLQALSNGPHDPMARRSAAILVHEASI